MISSETPTSHLVQTRTQEPVISTPIEQIDRTASSDSLDTSATDSTLSSALRFDRRHDLDALRAMAMLLGIVLHAALSFAPIPWTVRDTQQSDVCYVLFTMIHGFRMPLFFMLSGFFTAMLWRKRGIGGLLKQRFKRIVLPLLLGCLIIVPAMWAIGSFVSQPSSVQTGPAEIWGAVVEGDTARVRSAIESSEIAIDAVSQDGASLLTVAVFLGHTDMVEMLLEMGADVSQRNRDQGTALHSAAFVGRAEEAALLLNAGADPTLTDANGQSAKDLIGIDFDTTNFIATSFGLPLEKDRLNAGRAAIAKQFGMSDFPQSDDTQPDDRGGNAVRGFLFHMPVFMHLWFLWFLCWLIVAFMVYAPLANALNLQRFPQWLVSSPASLLWLVPLTMLPQASMHPMSFGPDPSIGLLPIPGVLAYYAIFFFFGAIYWDIDDTEGRLGREWTITLPIALVLVFPIGLDLVAAKIGLVSTWREHALHALAANFTQALFAWLMISGLIGACRRLLSTESRVMRYISDSSYWLYLIHLPLVLLAQWFVRDSTVPALVKFVGITVVTSGFLLLTYEYGVRYTVIGQLLNGPRKRVSSRPEANPVPAGDQ